LGATGEVEKRLATVQQQSLSRWLRDARSLPLMASKEHVVRKWTVEQKARVLAEASKLSGDQLTSYLDRQDVKLADFERWRIGLEEDGRAETATTKRICQLERELDRKEKALAEAAALLALKKWWTISTATRTAISTRRTRSDLGRDRRGASARRPFGASVSGSRLARWSAGALDPRATIADAALIADRTMRSRPLRKHRF